MILAVQYIFLSSHFFVIFSSIALGFPLVVCSFSPLYVLFSLFLSSLSTHQASWHAHTPCPFSFYHRLIIHLHLVIHGYWICFPFSPPLSLNLTFIKRLIPLLIYANIKSVFFRSCPHRHRLFSSIDILQSFC